MTKRQDMNGMDELTRRAMAAYFRSGAEGPVPESGHSGTERYEGLEYVVLRGGTGPRLLAVYRIQPRGQLKRLTMKRLPGALAREKELQE